MAFGLDPSIILSATPTPVPSINDTLQTLAQLASHGVQQRQGEAQLADLMRKQQQEDQLSAIFQRNAATLPPGLPRDLMAAGRGDQAAAWQDQAAQMAQKEAENAKRKQEVETAYRRHIGERFADVKDQASLDALRQNFASSTDLFLQHYAPQVPEKYDAAEIKKYQNQAFTAKELADLEQKELDRQNRTTNAGIIAGRPMPTVVQGEGGIQPVVDLRHPDRPGVTLRDEAGNPIIKPPPAKGSGATGAKEWKDFAEDFDVAKGKSNLNASAETARRRALELETLLNSHQVMSPSVVREAVSMAAQVANNGNKPTEAQVEEMSMKTAGMDLAKTLSYFTGTPEDAHVQGFINQLRKQSERAKLMGNANIMGSLLKKLSKHPDVLRDRATDAKNRLDALGITPDMYDADTLKPLYDPEADAMKEAAFTPEQEKAATWARANKKKSPEKAKKILDHLGLQR